MNEHMQCKREVTSGPGHTTGHCNEEAEVRIEVYATEPTRLVNSGFFCRYHARQLAEQALALGYHPSIAEI